MSNRQTIRIQKRRSSRFVSAVDWDTGQVIAGTMPMEFRSVSRATDFAKAHLLDPNEWKLVRS